MDIDHRRGVSFAPGELSEYFRTGWDLDQDVSISIEAVHQLSDLGAVVTHTAFGTSREGFDAEWRMIGVFTVDGDMPRRCEVFDEADLDAALARFEELHSPTRQLENAASRVNERAQACFAARDWDAMAEILTDEYCSDDRRHVVNVGRRGRDVAIANMQSAVDDGVTFGISDAIATRGQRLVLSHTRWSGPDQRPEAFHTEVLLIAEINADERIVARVWFDLNDIGAAFEELEARYLAGEAAPHAQTWSVITGGHAAFNRKELPPTTSDMVNIDHRRLTAFAPGEMIPYIRATWDVSPDINIFVQAVHRLNDLGAVITQTSRGTSQEGFDAEWREIAILTADGNLINRCEIFDEADLDSALARFDELHPQVRRLENAASRLYDRFNASLAARDWKAMAEMVTDDVCDDDRRRVVSGGIRHGRDAQTANLRAVVDVGVKNIVSVVIAIRGERLALTRTRVSGGDQEPEAFGFELLCIIEINADNRIAAGVQFDSDDIGAAFEELDGRYLAGEAAAHAHTWAVVAGECAAFKRHELPAADWVTIDHRPLVTIDASDLLANIRAGWDLVPDLSIHIEAVHRLSSFGAVVTYTAYGTSPQGFDAEWRMIQLLTVEGDRINRCEIFDETDLDAALARFEELHPTAQGLENAASQVAERFQTCFASDD